MGVNARQKAINEHDWNNHVVKIINHMQGCKMDYQEILLKNYNVTEHNYLMNAIRNKLAWFNFYVEKLYTQHLKIVQESPILELGCNKGFLLSSLQALGFKKLYGVDLSPDDLEVARK